MGESGSKAMDTVMRILRGGIAAQASDIHLKANVQPRVRVAGQLCPLDHPTLDEETVETAVAALAQLARVPADYQSRKQFDFSCSLPEVGRFRVHMYRQSGSIAAALRCIPDVIPDFASLRVPPVVKRIAAAERGLVLVTGATGNGKSTTIAALLEYVNQKLPRHVITIEDPIEYIFRDKVASFSQREVGRDLDDFHQGLVGALREDPDVLFVGEVRTHQEFDIALNAAESGRLVITTFHSPDVERAISRMVGFYPQDYRDGVRGRLADVLVGVISQRLIPKHQATEKILVTEVMTRAPTVIECIRDQARQRSLSAALEASTSEYGCHSFDQTLRGLVQNKLISLDTAKAHARSASDFVRSLKLMR